jgi:hypothetical protein
MLDIRTASKDFNNYCLLDETTRNDFLGSIQSLLKQIKIKTEEENKKRKTFAEGSIESCSKKCKNFIALLENKRQNSDLYSLETALALFDNHYCGTLLYPLRTALALFDNFCCGFYILRLSIIRCFFTLIFEGFDRETNIISSELEDILSITEQIDVINAENIFAIFDIISKFEKFISKVSFFENIMSSYDEMMSGSFQCFKSKADLCRTHIHDWLVTIDTRYKEFISQSNFQKLIDDIITTYCALINVEQTINNDHGIALCIEIYCAAINTKQTIIVASLTTCLEQLFRNITAIQHETDINDLKQILVEIIFARIERVSIKFDNCDCYFYEATEDYREKFIKIFYLAFDKALETITAKQLAVSVVVTDVSKHNDEEEDSRVDHENDGSDPIAAIQSENDSDDDSTTAIQSQNSNNDSKLIMSILIISTIFFLCSSFCLITGILIAKNIFTICKLCFELKPVLSIFVPMTILSIALAILTNSYRLEITNAKKIEVKKLSRERETDTPTHDYHDYDEKLNQTKIEHVPQ